MFLRPCSQITVWQHRGDMAQVSGEEARRQEIQSEEVLGAENGTKYHPDQEMMRRE